MNQAEMQEFFRQNFYYIIAAGVLIGVVLGAIPFLLAVKRKKKGLGWFSLVACAIAGGISPILAAILAIVLVIVVLKSGARKDLKGSTE